MTKKIIIKMSKLVETLKWRHQRFVVTPKDPEYTVHYLGSMRTLSSRGEECCEYPARKIWNNTDFGARYVKAKMYLGTKSVRLVRADNASTDERREDKEHQFYLHRIACCRVSKKYPSVFAWIYRHELPRLQVCLRVHVAVCNKEGKAWEITTSITRMYETAFEQYKRERAASANKKLEGTHLHTSANIMISSPSRISERSWSDESDGDEVFDDNDDDIHSMVEALPPTPLRRIINTRCPFKPPLSDRLSLHSQMLVIQESKDERDTNDINGNAAHAVHRLKNLQLMDSPTRRSEEETFEDFQPADCEF